MQNKKIITAGLIAAFGLAIMTSSSVFAQTESNEDRMTTIVQRIAEKFNLKESDVQAVFDAEKKDRMAKMESKHESRLSTLVGQGKITEEQKKLIISKNKELGAQMQTELEKLKDMTPDERKTEMEKKKSEIDAWAKENDIDPKYLMFFYHHKGGGHGMGMKFKMKLGE